MSASAATAGIVGGAALVAAGSGWTLASGASLLHPHEIVATPAGFLSAVVMWQSMMIAMMTPAVAPWVAAFNRILGADSERRAPIAALAFASGYFSAWLAYSISAAALQIALTEAGVAGAHGAPAQVAGPVLIAAGLFQFAPFRQACLTHCRNPLGYLLTAWRSGPPHPFRLGLRHGGYCVGCCWLLMLTALAMGLMNVAWMALLTVAVAVEQLTPAGVWAGRAAGVALIAWGAVLASPA